MLLLHLFLDSHTKARSDTRLSVIDLSTFSSLVSLRVWVPISDTAVVLALGDLLARANTTVIETVTLLCDYHHLHAVQPSTVSAWHAVDSALTDIGYSELKAIKLCVKKPSFTGQYTQIPRSEANINEASAIFRSLLPLSAIRGLLQPSSLSHH